MDNSPPAILYQMMKGEVPPQDTAYYQQLSDEAIQEAARLYAGESEVAFSDIGYSEDMAGRNKADGLIDSIKDGIKKIKKYVDKSFTEFKSKGKVQKVALDRSGAKGQGQIDEQRWAQLWWSY